MNSVKPDAHRELKTFLAVLLITVTQYRESGKTDYLPYWFDGQCGICDNWSNWTDEFYPYDREIWDDGRTILKGMFLRTPGITDSGFPFNAGTHHYHAESEEYLIWENEDRFGWLEKAVAGTYMQAQTR